MSGLRYWTLLYWMLPIVATSADDQTNMDPVPVIAPPDQRKLESDTENKVSMLHQIDTLNLMLYTFLLIVTVFTIWFFKHRRLRFVHETGLTLVYGLIVGMIIWLTSSGTPVRILNVEPTNDSIKLDKIPDYLQLPVPTITGSKSTEYNVSINYRYKFVGEERLEHQMKEDSLIETKATFDPEVFFNVLLPPIMFNAGYSLKRRNFFRNIGSILMFAVCGTTVSCIIVGLIMRGIAFIANITTFTLSESMLFGALISATDPVTVLSIFNDLQVESDLFAIVFGESALNDATAIVLFRTIEEYTPTDGGSTVDVAGIFRSIGVFLGVFMGSISVGAATGCVAALLTKFTKIRDFPLLETSLIVLISYMSFLTAEISGMTGVVAALFCGICQAHYTYNNLSDESQTRTKQFFELLNFLSENFIYTYIGVSMFTSTSHLFNLWFILGAFAAIVIGRAAHVYPFSFLLNIARRPKIPANYQHMMMFSGLRGAVAFALAIRNTSTKARCLMYTATALIVIFTVMINGGLTTQMIDWLKIKHGVDQETELQLQSEQTSVMRGRSTSTDNAGHFVAEQSVHNPWDKSFFPRQWYNFDRTFLKPLLTNSRPTLVETMPQCCLPLAYVLTTTQQLSAAINSDSRAESDGNLFSTGLETEDAANNGSTMATIQAIPPAKGSMV